MHKKKKKEETTTYEKTMIEALMSLPNPIIDKKHGLKIYFENDRARSNQKRFDHIIDLRHKLKPNDIARIPRQINKSKLKKDKDRKTTFNLYIKRNRYSGEYIKISAEYKGNKMNELDVKTIFITKIYK